VLLAIDDLQLHSVAEASNMPSRRPTWPPRLPGGHGYLFARPLAVGAMTELLAQSMADGGFHLPTADPVEAAAAT
jgi:hypothetical protein